MSLPWLIVIGVIGIALIVILIKIGLFEFLLELGGAIIDVILDRD